MGCINVGKLIFINVIIKEVMGEKDIIIIF